MHKLEIKLKQHTPLIHFQHDQDRATLRASEVKPKLDRFIIKQLGKENYEVISDDDYDEVVSRYEKTNKGKNFDDLSRYQQEYEVGKYIVSKEEWFIGKGDHIALNYKMRIQLVPPEEKSEFLLASYLNNEKIDTLRRNGIIALSNTPYFAQEKENGQISREQDMITAWDKIGKKGVLEKGLISMTLLSPNDSTLLNVISKHVQAFFLTTNCGTRQSKGFGSFTVKEIRYDGAPKELVSDEGLLRNYFAFVYKKTIPESDSNKKIERILSTINDDYRLLKSGLTHPHYAKSKMMLYAKSREDGWDKKYIKSQIEDGRLNCPYQLRSTHRQDTYGTQDQFAYYRAMLGLAEQIEFLLENPPANNASNKMIVKIAHPVIKRYQSPLLFKVIGNNIYLVGNAVSSEMLNTLFSLSVSVQKDNAWRDIAIEGISTPAKFSLVNFIRFAMKDRTNNAVLEYEQIK